jgi:hypothetical protein
MRAAKRFQQSMFERDNTPIWLGGLVAIAALAMVASYSQIRSVDPTPQAGFSVSGSAGDAGLRLSGDEIRELTNIAPAAGRQ